MNNNQRHEFLIWQYGWEDKPYNLSFYYKALVHNNIMERRTKPYKMLTIYPSDKRIDLWVNSSYVGDAIKILAL